MRLLEHGVIVVAVGLSVWACGGSSFGTSGTGGGGGAGGGSGGTAGTGGTATGGTGGGGAVGGSGGGVSGSGGGGGNPPGCPADPPIPAARCDEPGTFCNYPRSCCSDSYRCAGGTWQSLGCTGGAGQNECPANVPPHGAPCDAACDPSDCAYDMCPMSQASASCESGGWQVSSEACVDCDFGPAFVPGYDKTCSSNSDCAVLIIGFDCCGTGYAWGVRETDFDRASNDWGVCLSTLPQCGCPAGPTQVEGGGTALDTSNIVAVCRSSRCEAALP